MIGWIQRQVTATRAVAIGPSVFIRTLMKTHKGAAKRWKAIGNGQFKRGHPGRKHGNVGWSRGVLKALDGTTLAHGNKNGNHLKKLRRLLPYH